MDDLQVLAQAIGELRSNVRGLTKETSELRVDSRAQTQGLEMMLEMQKMQMDILREILKASSADPPSGPSPVEELLHKVLRAIESLEANVQNLDATIGGAYLRGARQMS